MNLINHSLFQLKNLVLPETMCGKALDWKIGREKKKLKASEVTRATFIYGISVSKKSNE